MPPSQHYFLPMPSFQQSIGGQPYPGQQVNALPYHLSNSGVADQSEGAVATGVHFKKMTLPIFSGQRKDWPEFKTVWKQLAEGRVGIQEQDSPGSRTKEIGERKSKSED